ncbi:sensor histidine kinase [Geothrix alkalitolerans]|uniref:sensor histidine kinase n=1 Tax=Geothrix alkalitolerans TaxID=2922724 RepID=UPI001FAFB5FF|nr:histidine kinase [Geothrix alkalitolerans]
MRASAVLQATWQRTRRPRTWGAALLFGLAWNGARLLLGWPGPDLLDLLAPSLWVVLFLVLAPLPWQWSGDEAPMASPPRGAVQALPWMAALTLVALLALTAAGASPMPMGRGPGAGPGRGMGMMEHGGPRRGPGPMPGSMMGPGTERHGFPIHPRFWALGVAHLCFGLLLGWVLADRERAEFQEAAARRAAKEAQTRALQGQMNPHVLFNAISGLTELVREDPAAAEAALVNLSDLLRALLDQGSRLRVPLGDERRLVERHLALERIRLGRRLRERWDWPAGLDATEVPPLMIQPLVENALKHGVSKAVGGGELEVVVRGEGTRLHIRVANTGPAPDGEGKGVGLANLRERLDLLGAGPEALRLRREGDWTIAELDLEVAP